jgi:hypothetical protein
MKNCGIRQQLASGTCIGYEMAVQVPKTIFSIVRQFVYLPPIPPQLGFPFPNFRIYLKDDVFDAVAISPENIRAGVTLGHAQSLDRGTSPCRAYTSNCNWLN